VRNSVIMNDTIIRAGASVANCVLDKHIEVGPAAQLGYGKDSIPNQLEPSNLYTGITIVGKSAVIPAKAVIGKNCRIDPDTGPSDYETLDIPSGSSILKK